VRFDEINLGSGTGAVGNAEIEARSWITFQGILHSAVDQNACTCCASGHAGLPLMAALRIIELIADVSDNVTDI
jgi:hypothetical protein